MVDMNGIPKAFSPAQFRQEFNDFKRQVEARLSAPKYVSIGNIVEGGTISQNAGAQLTETVQKEIVIERQNLSEAALTDVVVTGSITTRGETTEVPPRPIDVSLTTFSRNLNGALSSNAGIVFQAEGQDESFAPGVYSPDGRVLTLATTDGRGATSYLQLGPATQIVSPEFVIGPYLAALLRTDVEANLVTIGRPSSLFSPGPSDVSIQGKVTVNGAPLSAPGPWIDLPLLNGWKITNSNKMRPSYRITGDTIEFRGSISGGTSNIIAQMPTGARALKEENKVVPQYNTGWVNGTVSVAPDGYVRLDTYASNVYSVNLDFSYSTSP